MYLLTSCQTTGSAAIVLKSNMLKLRHLSNRKYFEIIKKTFATTGKEEPRVKKYTDTVILPKTAFPVRLKATARADVVRHVRETCFANLYKWQREHLNGKEFVLHDGPPYANGDLHMGHAINKVLKDVVIRHQIINGNKVHYRPGWDCHGLPIEMKAKIKKGMSPVEIRQKAREFALQTQSKHKADFASWGLVSDWQSEDGIYRTIDSDYVRNQLNIFWDLFNKKLIYRDLKPVYFSPSSGTALAEFELEYTILQSPSLTLRLKLINSPRCLSTLLPPTAQIFALIWTTTPWTLPMNQAVCYNPELTYNLVKLNDKEEYYIVAKPLLEELVSTLNDTNVVTVAEFDGSELEHCSYLSPVQKIEQSFWPGDHVCAKKGTGLIHTAPAHGADDYLLSLKRKEPLKCFIDDTGRYNQFAPEFLRSKSVQEDGNNLVLEHIGSDIVHLGSLSHSCPVDWRTKKPVIMTASNQWFINTDLIKDAAIEETNKVNFYPDLSDNNIYRKEMITRLESRAYWCISRQRAWGVPIPVFYSKASGEVIVNKEIINHICSEINKAGNIDFWWQKSEAELIPKSVLDKCNVKADDLVKGQDILDIWFDSGISWSYVLDEPKVADLYLEGHDQFTGWFQSSLLTSVACRGISPYKSIFVHGFALDEKGAKMSKSKGNIVSPSDIIEKYGIDGMRWWIASHVGGNPTVSVKTSALESVVQVLANFRNVLKYILGSRMEIKEPFPHINLSKLSALDKYFLNSLVELDDQLKAHYAEHNFGKVTRTLKTFFSNNLSADYIDLKKDELYCASGEDSATSRDILLATFCILNRHLWPIVPFLVEECWSYYEKEPFYKTSFSLPESWRNHEFNDAMDATFHIRGILRENLPKFRPWDNNVDAAISNVHYEAIKKIHSTDGLFHNNTELCDILQVQSVRLTLSESSQTEINTTEIEQQKCPRCRRFELKESREVCSRCELVLNKL